MDYWILIYQNCEFREQTGIKKFSTKYIRYKGEQLRIFPGVVPLWVQTLKKFKSQPELAPLISIIEGLRLSFIDIGT